LGGWMGDRMGRMRAIRCGYLFAVPMLAGLVMAPTPGWALAFTALLGVSMFIPFAAQVTLAQDYLPHNPATASGITLGLALSVGGLVSPLFGMLSDVRGLGTTLTAVLCVLCVAAVLAFRLRNRAPLVLPAEVEAAAAA
jgi:FSR family fosmidomycin resistance protein-like MFS transporter